MAIDDFPRQLASTRYFTLGIPHAVTVSRDGRRVLFLRTRGGEDPVTCLWGLDLADGAGDGGGVRERLIIDPAASWHFGPGDMPEAERVRRERAREAAAGIVAYSADADCRTVVFALDGRLWVLRVGDDPREPAGAPEPVPAAGAATDPRIDPAGQRVAYVADGALHVTELADGTGRLSRDQRTVMVLARPSTSPPPMNATRPSGTCPAAAVVVPAGNAAACAAEPVRRAGHAAGGPRA